jgi:hypothetical protein
MRRSESHSEAALEKAFELLFRLDGFVPVAIENFHFSLAGPELPRC